MRPLKIIVAIVASVLLLQSCTKPQNWYQYLGPGRNASASGKEILRSWGESGPKELWSFELGEGYGGAAVFDDEVFVLDRKKGEADILRCIDVNTGAEKWNFEYRAEGELSFPGSRAVPTVDKNHIYSVGPHGDFYCIDKKTHKPLWHHNLKEEYETKLSQWGYSQSPLLYKDLVIVSPHGNKAGVVAFNKKSGEVAWESRPLTGHSYHVSPTLASYGGIDQVIMISPYDRQDSSKTQEVVAFECKTGKELWRYEGLKSFSTIAPVTVIDEKRLFLTDCSYNGNYGPVSIMLDITKNPEGFSVEEIFLTEEAGCKMHPPVIVNNYLYINSTGRPNQMQCLSMDGETMWEYDSTCNFEMGALILVNDLIISQNGRNGDIHLVEPSPDGYRELGKASLFNSKKSQAWAPIAYYDGKIIARDMEKMVCVDLHSLAE